MDFYKIEGCKSSRGCPRAVGNTGILQEKLEGVFKTTNFAQKRQNQLGSELKHHQIFKIGLAGCANCCSQPQIKDVGFVAKSLPVIDQEACMLCGRCVRACKERSLSILDREVHLNKEKCLGCGDCRRVCSIGAISASPLIWRLLIGGKLGRHPRLAKEIREISSQEGALFLEKCINKVLNSSPQERIADILME